MRLLPDTHALIWAVQAPEQRGDRARSALTGPDAQVYASHVSQARQSALALVTLDRHVAQYEGDVIW